jgi:signal transduction histidine kinase
MAEVEGGTPMAIPMPAPPTNSTFVWVRALVLVAAGLLGGGMFAGNAFRGSLTFGTLLEVLVGWSFVACGMFLWSRRPANRLGPMMTIVGFLWLLGRTMQLIPNAVIYPAGLWLTDLWALGFAVFLLAFPTGRLTSRAESGILGLFLFVAVPLEFLWLVFLVPANGLNALALAPDAGAAELVDRLQRVIYSAAAALLVLALGLRWLRSTGPARVQMAPVIVGSVAILLQSAEWIFFSYGQSSEGLNEVIRVALIAIPIAVLFVIFRARLARAGVADLVVELGQTPTPARLQDALSNALGDRSLRLGYWSADQEGFLNATGQALSLPAEGGGQAVTMLERNGAPEVAIIHDATLLDEPGLITAVVSAMRLAVENERLTAAVEDQLAEVRASRARIVAAGDAERQRVERDLHDGAQQRIVALTLALRLARTRLGSDADPAVQLSLEQASEEAKAALSELRELARGIHPQILTAAGLYAAVESLATRTPTKMSVAIDPDARFVPSVEAVAYFVVSESLANVAKYAEATAVTVRAVWADGFLTVEVADDGRGGADPQGGSGLRGLIDRLAAVDGSLEVVSPPGGGTRIIARIPTAGPTIGAEPTDRVET